MNLRIATIVIGASAVLVLAAGPALATLPAYNVTNIGTLAGTQSPWNYGFGLSSSGNYVVGGCVWTSSAIDIMGYIPVGYRYTGAVNSLGPIPPSQAASGWGNGGPDAGAGSIGGINGNMPWAVNSSGTVVGQHSGSPFYSTGGGAPVAIPGTPSGAAAYGINNSGLIVGDWDNSGSSGFIYNLGNSQLTQIGMAAYGVSSGGIIAGAQGGWSVGAWRETNGTIHTVPAVYSFSGIDSSGKYLAGQDVNLCPALYTIGGGTVTVAAGGGGFDFSWSVNSSGVVVGATAATHGSYSTDAFIYNGATHYIGDLTLIGAPSNVQWTTATSINDAGQILVQAQVGGSSGMPETFLLTPVPEPSTLLLTVAGLAGLLVYAWRKRA